MRSPAEPSKRSECSGARAASWRLRRRQRHTSNASPGQCKRFSRAAAPGAPVLSAAPDEARPGVPASQPETTSDVQQHSRHPRVRAMSLINPCDLRNDARQVVQSALAEACRRLQGPRQTSCEPGRTACALCRLRWAEVTQAAES